MRILAILIIFITAQGHAEVFKRYSPALKKKHQADNVFHLKLEGGLNCSAFFIGPNGEALTNLHCIEPCLEKAEAVSSERFGNLEKRNVAIDRPVTCQAEISQGKKPQQTSLQVLKIFGPGYLSPREKLPEFLEKYPDLHREALAEGYEGWGDLALVQLASTGSCVRLNPIDFSRNQSVPVFNLSFPIVFRLPEKPNPFNPEKLFTLGLTLLFSKGEATRNADIFKVGMTNEEVDFIQKHLPEGLILSSVDVEGGSSGSPLFSESGEVVGVMRSTFNPSMTEFRAWMGGAVDLNRHYSEILRWVPENVNCLPSGADLK